MFVIVMEILSFTMKEKKIDLMEFILLKKESHQNKVVLYYLMVG